MAIRHIACLLIGYAVLASSPVFCAESLAADWPQWRGPSRDAVVADFQPPATWPGELQQVWSVEVGEGHSSPVVAGNRIYQFGRRGDDEVMSCLDASGNLLWSNQYAAPYKMHPAARGHGKSPKSTPAVAGGQVFALGISGILSCWSASDGKQLWRRDFACEFKTSSPDFGAAMSPLVRDGVCIAHVGGKGDGALAAFSVETGAPRWSWEKDGPAYTSPMEVELAGRRQLVTQSQNQCLGLSTDGELLWSFEYKTGYEQNIVTPVVIGDLVIFSGYQRGVTAYRITSGGGQLSAEQAWHNADVSMYMSSPVLVGGSLYGFSERRRGQFFRLDPRTGETIWTGPPRQGDNALLLAAGNMIMALTTGGELVVFDQGSDDYQEIARYKLADSPTWAHPALVGDRLLIKDATSLSMWRIGK